MRDNRIPTLDGWRGLAVLLVLILHFQIFYNNHYFFNNRVFGFGEHGVAIFFVLSGFLITNNLCKRPKVDLLRFYIRRFFRLMPAAWAYLLALYVTGLIAHVHYIYPHDAVACLLSYRNLIHNYPFEHHTIQFWSLSSEEQFYVIWPFVLVFFTRRASIIFASIVVLGFASYKVLHTSIYFPVGGGFPAKPFVRFVQFDEIAIGCLLAFLLESEAVREWFHRNGSRLFYVCAPIVFFDVCNFQAMPPFHEVILIALMMGCTMLNPQMTASRFFELPHLKTTGVFCYGIYLWQGLWIDPLFGPLGVLLLPLAVFGSWFLIEQPSLRLGDKLWNRLNTKKQRSRISVAEAATNSPV